MNPKQQFLLVVTAATLMASSGGVQLLHASTPPVLDQSQTFHNGIDRVGGNINIAQIFTPSTSGYLDNLMLYAGRQNAGETMPFVVSIADTQSGVPQTVLGTVSQTDFIPDVRSWYTYDFSSQAIVLNAGVKYAVVVSCPGSFNGIGFGVSMTDLYPGGQELERIGSSGWGSPNYPATGNAGADLAFQTYMTPIPEPSVPALALLGALLLATLRRLKQPDLGC